MNKKYAIGLDFGSLSARALIIDAATGKEIADAVEKYPHGFIEETLPGTEEKLPTAWTLQDPQDYLYSMSQTIKNAIKKAGIDARNIVGLGIDFTACTVLPIKKDGTPLCFLPEFKNNKHAFVKLWKHHAAQDQANRINELAKQRGEKWLPRYGKKISSEWLFAKILQILEEAPEVYDAMGRFIEATDWIIMQLTGVATCNNCAAGYCAMWHKQEGYPSNEFFKALDPRLENVVDEKLSRNVDFIGSKAGEITEEAAKLFGLNPGTAVAVGNVDAHVAVPAVGINEPGSMLMIMGTSTCHLILSKEEKLIPGICGYVEDGILPGMLGYQAGQSCVGDHFDWFVNNCVPTKYKEDAQRKGMIIYEYLREKAKLQKPGESGLVALDWWNGNRTVLVDTNLTGMMLGMTLLTKPEEMYRALIEATAYGTRIIIETFEKGGLPINNLYACGSIAVKDDLIMQIYADVMNREIRISSSTQTMALGAAMYGAVAAGSSKGGYDSIIDASKVIPKINKRVYRPIKENVETYNKLFAEYTVLHDYFGRGSNDVMKRLKNIKMQARD